MAITSVLNEIIPPRRPPEYASIPTGQSFALFDSKHEVSALSVNERRTLVLSFQAAVLIAAAGKIFRSLKNFAKWLTGLISGFSLCTAERLRDKAMAVQIFCDRGMCCCSILGMPFI